MPRRRPFRLASLPSIEHTGYLAPRQWLLRIFALPSVQWFLQRQDYGRDLDVLLSMRLDTLYQALMDCHEPEAYARHIESAIEQLDNSELPWLPEALNDNTAALAKTIGLNETETQIMTFAAMLAMQPTLQEAAIWLGSELSLPEAAEHLAHLLQCPLDETRRALSIDGLLLRSGLFELNIHGQASLRDHLALVGGGFLQRLFSPVDEPLQLLSDIIRPCEASSLTRQDFSHIEAQLDLLLPWLRHAQDHARKGVNAYLHGQPGTGKSQLARIIAQQLSCPLYEVTSEDANAYPVTGSQRIRALRLALFLLARQRCLLLFDEAEDIFGSTQGEFSPFPRRPRGALPGKGWMNRLLEENPIPVLWLSNEVDNLDQAYIRRFDLVFELPVPPTRQREAIIAQCAGQWLSDEQIQRIAGNDHLAPAIITRAVVVVSTIHPQLQQHSPGQAIEMLVENTLSAQGRLPASRPSLLPGHYDPDYVNTNQDLHQLAEGIAQHGNARLCLYGPPGTGKSAFAHWLARELDRPLHIHRGADLLSMWVGGTEKQIAQAFRQAEQARAVLLIDEIDSFLQDRRQAQRSWEMTQVNEMLTRMETFQGIMVATTNLIDGLDQAAMRRFDLKLYFDYLAEEQAWQLFQHHCHGLGLTPDNINRQRIKRLDRLTPGDFAAVARRARFAGFGNAAELANGLAEELDLKTDNTARPIGFIG